jgi:hypothetical protein
MAIIRTVTAFPDPNIPDKEKKEKYHRDFINAITHASINNTYEKQGNVMQKSYDYFTNTYIGEESSFLQTTENGTVLPAKWLPFNSILPKIKTLVGEAASRGFEVQVRTVNKHAKSKKLDLRHEKLAEMYIKEDLQMLEDQTGLPSTPQGPQFESEAELDYWLENGYKDTSEKVIEAALKELRERLDWDLSRMYLFRDLFVAGRIFVKTYLREGRPHARVIDPRYMVFDSNSRDDFLKNSTYFGEIRYVPLAELVQEYNLTSAEIDQIKNSVDSASNWFSAGSNTINGTRYSFVTPESNNLKVMVLEAEWLDFQEVKRRKFEDKHGNVHYKTVPKKYKGKDVVSRKIKCWRKGTLLGGMILRDWGKVENTPRSVDNIDDLQSNYTCLLPDFVNFSNVSMSQLIENIQEYKNVLLYQLQLAFNRSGSKGVTIDVSALPDKWSLDDVISQMKTTGVLPFNGSRFGGMQNMPFREFDLSVAGSVEQIMGAIQMLDGEMERITSVNSARQGFVEGASQAVGVTENALVQSSLVTAGDFKKVDKFEEKVFTKLANLCKITYLNKEIFADLVGDIAIDYFDENLDINLQDFGAYIKISSAALSNKNELKQLVMTALQSGAITFSDALSVLDEDDPEMMKIVLDRSLKEREMQQQEMQMQQMQIQEQARQQGAMQLEDMKQKNNALEEEMKGLRQSKIEDQRHQNRMQLDNRKADTDLRNKLLTK